MTKVGVVLSGCGFLDGSEIHEATLTLFFLDRAGAEIIKMAPDIDQMDVIDHLSSQAVEGETRKVLTESARIARGEIKRMEEIKADDLDALIFPGGYGAAKNLSDFAVKGVDCTVNPEVERLVKEMHQAKKPLGFLCIAPVIAAKVLATFSPQLTVGNAKEELTKSAAEAIEKMGAKHIACEVAEIAVDEENKIISAPAYMIGPTISKVGLGIERLVNKVLELASG
ncbi:MAG: Glyoxalase ElbB [candidate division WS2 bacterium]|nr:Glyoxalase ElbB [Candidatus Lithacetigena glycinireducens]MBT9175536.1 Glyoxalase ElbB [Candidatus Lithacetigena glycinireducens]